MTFVELIKAWMAKKEYDSSGLNHHDECHAVHRVTRKVTGNHIYIFTQDRERHKLVTNVFAELGTSSI